MDKAYISNLHKWWKIERQKELLAEKVPGWPVATYVDDLKPALHRRHNLAEVLRERHEMLRPTSRREGGDIWVASLAVLAREEDDFKEVVKQAQAMRFNIYSAETDTAYLYTCPIAKLVKAWHAARTKSRLEGAAKLGGQVSADRRKAITAAKLAIIADRLPLPSSKWPTRALLDEAGIRSVNTIKNTYGVCREVLQARYQAKLKRAAKREGRAV